MQFLYNLDGDSFFAKSLDCKKLLSKNSTLKCDRVEIRMMGIDAPEYSQAPWGLKAKDFLHKALSSSNKFQIELANPFIDKYGRVLAFVFVNKKLINNSLLEAGLAEIYTLSPYHPYLILFKQSEFEARQKHLNIWDPISGLKMSPSEYRQIQKRKSK